MTETTAAAARELIEAETRKTRPERARALVEGLGEPIALVVAGWLAIEADALELEPFQRRPDGPPDTALERAYALRELARALQDAAPGARGTLEP